MIAKYRGKCEVCLGAITPGDEIRPCGGIMGAWEHASEDRCRRAREARIRETYAGLAREGTISAEQAERAIAVQREKLAKLETRREAIKAANAAYRKEHREELKGLGAYEKDQRMPHAGYELRNLGGNITRTRQRIDRLAREAANGGPPDRVMTARYGGPCEECGREIERGDTIRYSRGRGARCAQCPTTEGESDGSES